MAETYKPTGGSVKIYEHWQAGGVTGHSWDVFFGDGTHRAFEAWKPALDAATRWGRSHHVFVWTTDTKGTKWRLWEQTGTMTPTLRVEPVSPVIGAEVSGVDLTTPLDDATLDALQQALARYLVLFFRDQELTLDQHEAVGRRFGDLHVHPAAPKDAEHPEVLVVHADENVTFVAGSLWHSDVSCDAEPPMGSILRVVQVPSSGGDTLFSSMFAAFDALSDRMQQLLCGLTAVHEGEHYYRGRYGSTDLRDTTYPVAEHPVVRTHPVTGRRALFVNEGFTTRLKDLPVSESDALLAFLFKHCANPAFQCRFHWRPHSIAFWDNRSTQHLAIWDYYPEVRHGYRVTIKGDRPYYDRDALRRDH